MSTQPPVPRAFELTPELLETQGRALRGLAKSLLGDAHAADDVVQETWLTCLRHPGALPVRVSAWLGTVTRRLALRRMRGEQRREVREHRAAGPERLEEVAQRTLEREEGLRAVTQALLALEEPFKSALILRYYEDRAPSQIADELGLPLATVKSRLARGLEKLRAKLGSEFRGDEASRTRALRALAGIGLPVPLAPLLPSGASAAPALGGAVLGAKLAAAALVVGGGTLWWWTRAELPRAGAAAAASVATNATPKEHLARGAAESNAEPSLVSAQDGASQREAVPPVPAAPERAETFPPEASFSYHLTGRVRDERDLPLSGVGIYLAPHLFPFNRVATTDDEGRFDVTFDARRSTLDVALGVEGDGRSLGMHELRLVAGQALELDVGLQPAGQVLLDGQSQLTLTFASSGAKAVYDFSADAEHEAVVNVANILRERIGRGSRGRLDCAPEMLRRADGRGLFVDPGPSLPCARAAQEENMVAERLSLAEQRDARFLKFSVDLREHLALGVLAHGDFVDTTEAPPKATLRGVVRDASGGPAAGVEVGWGPPGRTLEQSVRTDASGAFALEGVPPGEVALRAGGGDDGVASERVTLASAQEFLWSPILERGTEVAGRVVLSGESRPLAGARVELWSVSPSAVWCDSTITNEDGRFAIPNVPSGPLDLCVVPADSKSAFPTLAAHGVFGGSDLGELRLDASAKTATLELALLDAKEESIPGSEVRVWQPSSGVGVFAAGPGEKGAFTLAGLPAGAYRVEVGSSLGWRDLGTVWVDPTRADTLALGTERFARPGLAQLTTDPPKAATLALWSANPDVFGQVVVPESEGRVLVPLRAGDYVVCAAGERGKRCETPLTVKAGEVEALAIERMSSGALTARPGSVDPAFVSTEAARCAACHAGSESVRGVIGTELVTGVPVGE